MKRTGLLSLKQFRETALGDMKGDIGSDTNKEVADEIIEIIKDFDEEFRILFVQTIHEGNKEAAFLDALKKLIGLVKTLKELPDEQRQNTRDPLSNTVARPHDGPDGPDGAGGSQ